jgi:uncharacterized protein (TIGR00255 family)
MAVTSMTGFARADGAHDGLAWHWEAKSVNGRALDVRCRLPQGLESLEIGIRASAARHFRRGNLQVTLQLSRGAAPAEVRLNEPVVEAMIALAEDLRRRLDSPPVRAEHLLALRGVVEVSEPIEDEAAAEARDAALLASLDKLFTDLAAMRADEGRKLEALLVDQIDRIAELTEAARQSPERSPDTIRARLVEQIARLTEAGPALDADRLYQEAVIAAQKSDVQEEIDRLVSHVEAGRDLLASPEPVGRKFDFLAQEFNREANTLCSKANGRELTRIGLELKSVIDQMREQVQNLE